MNENKTEIPSKCGVTCSGKEWCAYPEWCEVIEKSTPVEIPIKDIAAVGSYTADRSIDLSDNEWHGYSPVIVRKIDDKNYGYEVLEGESRISGLAKNGWDTVFAIVAD